MIHLYAAASVQTGFYLPLYSVLFYSAFLWSGGQVMKELYGNIFNKQKVYKYYAIIE
jgi:hypothetical protein